jgi:hypothetical protein
MGEALGYPVRCGVSREALEDHFGANARDREGRLESAQGGPKRNTSNLLPSGSRK